MPIPRVTIDILCWPHELSFQAIFAPITELDTYNFYIGIWILFAIAKGTFDTCKGWVSCYMKDKVFELPYLELHPLIRSLKYTDWIFLL